MGGEDRLPVVEGVGNDGGEGGAGAEEEVLEVALGGGAVGETTLAVLTGSPVATEVIRSISTG